MSMISPNNLLQSLAYRIWSHRSFGGHLRFWTSENVHRLQHYDDFILFLYFHVDNWNTKRNCGGLPGSACGNARSMRNPKVVQNEHRSWLEQHQEILWTGTLRLMEDSCSSIWRWNVRNSEQQTSELDVQQTKQQNASEWWRALAAIWIRDFFASSGSGDRRSTDIVKPKVRPERFCGSKKKVKAMQNHRETFGHWFLQRVIAALFYPYHFLQQMYPLSSRSILIV